MNQVIFHQKTQHFIKMQQHLLSIQEAIKHLIQQQMVITVNLLIIVGQVNVLQAMEAMKIVDNMVQKNNILQQIQEMFIKLIKSLFLGKQLMLQIIQFKDHQMVKTSLILKLLMMAKVEKKHMMVQEIKKQDILEFYVDKQKQLIMDIQFMNQKFIKVQMKN